MDKFGTTIADLKAWIAENDFPDDARVRVWGSISDNGEGEIHVEEAFFEVTDDKTN